MPVGDFDYSKQSTTMIGADLAAVLAAHLGLIEETVVQARRLPLADLGLDSLMAVELSADLARDHGTQLADGDLVHMSLDDVERAVAAAAAHRA